MPLLPFATRPAGDRRPAATADQVKLAACVGVGTLRCVGTDAKSCVSTTTPPHFSASPPPATMCHGSASHPKARRGVAPGHKHTAAGTPPAPGTAGPPWQITPVATPTTQSPTPATRPGCFVPSQFDAVAWSTSSRSASRSIAASGAA